MRRQGLTLIELLVVIAVIAILAGMLSIYPSYLKLTRLRADLQEVEAEVAVLDTENRALQEEVEGLESDPVVIESAIRRILRLGREGEVTYRIAPTGMNGDEHQPGEPDEAGN